MEQAPGIVFDDIDIENIDDSFNLAKNYLKEKVEYIFINDKHNKNHTWMLSTWSKRICHSEILKHGTVKDKEGLSEEHRWNKKRISHKNHQT